MSRSPIVVSVLALSMGCSAELPWDAAGAASAKGSAALSWMGVYGDYERHEGGNPGTFTVLMNQDYVGLHAELGYRIEGEDWVVEDMSWVEQVDGNSLWQLEPTDAFPAGSTVSYYFRGHDDWGREIWDSNGGANYQLEVPSGYAEHWIEPLDLGLWPDEDYETAVWA